MSHAAKTEMAACKMNRAIIMNAVGACSDASRCCWHCRRDGRLRMNATMAACSAFAEPQVGRAGVNLLLGITYGCRRGRNGTMARWQTTAGPASRNASHGNATRGKCNAIDICGSDRQKTGHMAQYVCVRARGRLLSLCHLLHPCVCVYYYLSFVRSFAF